MSSTSNHPHPRRAGPFLGWMERLRRQRSKKSRTSAPLPAQKRRAFIPSVRSLEPRFVLNASAELGSLGQLLITGTDFAETVQIEVDAGGDVLLRDQDGQIIPISGHPTDPVSPLSPNSISARQVVVDLAGGDDQLNLQIPSGLDLHVVDGDGNDRVAFAPAQSAGPLGDTANTIRIESESIEFGSSFVPFQLRNDRLELLGDVVVGSPGGTTRLDFAGTDVQINGNATFMGNVDVKADTANVSGAVNVVGDSTVTLDAPLTGTNLVKEGSGTLVLREANSYTGLTEVREGTLIVEGSIDSRGDIVVSAGARLEGDGVVAGRIVASEESTISPSDPQNGLSIETLRVGGLSMTSTTTLSLEIDGQTSDQIVVAPASGPGAPIGTVSLGGALLDLSVGGTVSPATEFVLISNDGVDPVDGRLRAFFDADGSMLSQPRLLEDGATVLNSLGAPGQNAHITYFGGDGNDVTIVTSGGFDIASQGATLVTRNGVNLEIRTGTDLAAATAAAPVIRPILGRSDNIVRIVGSSADDTLFVDVDDFFSQAPGAPNFTGSIVMDAGESSGDNDQIRIFDSNPATSDDPTIDYEFLRGENGIVTIDPRSGLPKLQIRFNQTEAIHHSIDSNQTTFQFAGEDDQVTLSVDPGNENQTLVETLSDGEPNTSISFVSPQEQLAIRLCDGDDTLTIQGIADDFAASIRMNGEDGSDRVVVAADLSLGSPAAAGDVSITSESIRIDGEIETTGGIRDGNIDLTATTTLTVTSTISSGNGRVSLDGGDGVIDLGAGEIQADATSAPIRISTASDVVLGDVTSPTGMIIISDVSGSVTQAEDTRLQLANTSITAEGDVDLANVENEFAVVDVVAGDSVRLTDSQGDLTIQSVTSDSGSARITNLAGSVFAQKIMTPNGSIDITVNGSTSDIVVGNLNAGFEGDVALTAGDDVRMDPAFESGIIIGDDLAIRAINATPDQDAAIEVVTNVNDFEAEVLEAARGDIIVNEADDIRLASSDRADDGEILRTSNGEIRVTAVGSIDIIDANPFNDTNDLASDRELIASGDNGRIRLEAGATLRLGDSAQISASQSSVAAVTLQATSAEFGNDIEINTGQDVGVARVFAPRPPAELPEIPASDPIKFAFYDPESITTNRLRQANVNDATGILTIDIGRPGERGLTLNVDWGAETDRFQQIDNIHADDALVVDVGSDTPRPAESGASVFRVEHFYTENDIVSSRLNGRESETKPLNVRFSVRHHESILVLADSATQSQSGAEFVSTGIVSATDNDNPIENLPLEQLTLNAGTASFIIPSLSIPVAFFPVRDVIPEFDEPEVFVRQESTIFLTQSSLQTAEASPSSSVSRDEYLQIRMLSPEPGGEDLAPPERLPDDILDGDKLQELFSELPDGRYEIEYVLGDGNERLILRVDLRNGRPIIPGDELQGGTLRLIPVDDSNDDPTPRVESEDQDQQNPQPDEQKHEEPRQPRQGDLRDEKASLNAGEVTNYAALAVVTTVARQHNTALQRERSSQSRGRLSAAKRMVARATRRSDVQKDTRP